MTIFLSSAKDLIAVHSSWDKLECATGFSKTVKSSSSTVLRKTSKCGSSLGGFQDDLVWNAGFSLKSNIGSLRKCHLILIRRQNFPKSDLNSGSLIFLWVQNLNLSPRPWTKSDVPFLYRSEKCNCWWAKGLLKTHYQYFNT